ncbi:MAG: hypothetical protein RLZZ499_1439 [Cyanobacteriota bacterium]
MSIERRGLKPAAAFGYEASHPKHAAINPKGYTSLSIVRAFNVHCSLIKFMEIRFIPILYNNALN